MMRALTRTKSKIAIVLLLCFSLAMLAYRFSGIYRGTRFSGARAANVLKMAPRSGPIAPSGNYTVKHIYDGDTISLNDGSVVRYAGVDTPEKDQPHYQEATAANTALIGGKTLDVRFCTQRQSDKYGRRLATIFVEGKDVSLELLREGRGRVFSDLACVDSETLDGYWQAAIEAYRQKKGMWAERPQSPAPVADVGSFINKSVAVCGEIKNIFRGPQAIHINFGTDPGKSFSATVFNRDEMRFKQAGVVIGDSLIGQKVSVFGHIVEHEGPNMVISSPREWYLTEDCTKEF